MLNYDGEGGYELTEMGLEVSALFCHVKWKKSRNDLFFKEYIKAVEIPLLICLLHPLLLREWKSD